MPSVMWQRVDGIGLERAGIEMGPGGLRLSSTALLVEEGAGHEIRASVAVAAEGWVRTVGARVISEGEDRSLALSREESGSWTFGDRPLIELYGATDVDLRWSPLGHGLALRRLALDVGEAKIAQVVVVGFPDRDLRRASYLYERKGPDRYAVVADGETLELHAGPAGLLTAVVSRWESVAGVDA